MSPIFDHGASWRLVVLLTTLVVVAVLGTAWVTAKVDRQQRTLACLSAQANISQLEALAALEHRLGVPMDFTIPPLPEECV